MTYPAANIRVRVKGTSLYVEQHRPRAEVATGGSGVPAYDAVSRSARLANWKYNNSGPNSTITGALDVMQGRSRDMVRKNGLADGALEKMVDNYIGSGIKPLFKTADPEFNKFLAKAWRRWTKEADANGEYDYYGLQALAARSMFEAGDVFKRFRPRRRGDMRSAMSVPLQLQVLESEFCPVSKNETLGAGRIIQCGIEFDAIGRKTNYWMYREHPYDMNLRRMSLGIPVPIPASQIVHVKSVKRPGMVRGEPWLARVLVKLNDLDKYDDAQLVRQQIAAMFAGFVSPDIAGQFATEGDPDDNGVAVGDLEPGSMHAVAPGAEVRFSQPPSVGESYEAFNRQQHRYIAVAVGGLYEELSGDFTSGNDRTWRAAFNSFKRKMERLQYSIFVFQMCEPVLWQWAAMGIVSGIISPPAGVTIEDICDADWFGPAFDYINPVQDIEAQRAEIRAGLSSRAQMVSRRGYDVEDIDNENSTDNARTDRLGLIYDSNAKHVSNAGVTQARPGGSGFAEPGDEPEQGTGGGNGSFGQR
jgi:lambda family phage portal protein